MCVCGFCFVLFARQFHWKHVCLVLFIMSYETNEKPGKMPLAFQSSFYSSYYCVAQSSVLPCSVWESWDNATICSIWTEMHCGHFVVYKAQRIQICWRSWKCLVPRFSPWIVAFFVAKPRNIFSWSLIRNRSRQPDTLYLRKQIRSTWPLLWKLFCLWCSATNAPTIFHTLRVRWGRLV